ncbi:unnamed protein product [Paramecium octaurelia]|uniref:Uncharacterized protein n=1 Tax=Paramecium octaurelia TaxID=43137 RepID=A0A8S1TBP8_PAROT|nr:unnamed protein product [Paramecium octaurelia]
MKNLLIEVTYLILDSSPDVCLAELNNKCHLDFQQFKIQQNDEVLKWKWKIIKIQIKKEIQKKNRTQFQEDLTSILLSNGFYNRFTETSSQQKFLIEELEDLDLSFQRIHVVIEDMIPYRTRSLFPDQIQLLFYKFQNLKNLWTKTKRPANQETDNQKIQP